MRTIYNTYYTKQLIYPLALSAKEPILYTKSAYFNLGVIGMIGVVYFIGQENIGTNNLP